MGFSQATLLCVLVCAAAVCVPHAAPVIAASYYSTGDQVSARALINLRFQYLIKCALTVSVHVLRFQYLFNYLVRTNLYSKIGTNVLTTRLVRTPSKISILN
jgi:hypothetical protein